MKAHRVKEKIKIEESSGNVFKDLGHPKPDEALVKAKLALHIAKIVETNDAALRGLSAGVGGR